MRQLTESSINSAPKASIILATYNWPEALSLSLQSLAQQTEIDFEVVIADDGSKSETTDLIANFKATSPFALHHEWQEDVGFRKSKILNKAIQRAQGAYLIFLDGDCIVQPDYVAQHFKLAESGVMVTGSRILLEQKLTFELCDAGRWSYSEWIKKSFGYRLTGQINKWLPLMIKWPNVELRKYRKFVWSRIKGCNMAAWRSDVVAMNGFDEALEGWGHEDADFVFRLQQRGVVRKSGAWATEVLHLWHKTLSKENAAKNAALVREKILAKKPLINQNQAT
jgi:glycosyltransferase involved in cell wall biosynthesis